VGAAALALAALGCATQREPAPAPDEERPAWVEAAKDVGRTEGSEYVHDGLGLSVTLPEGWVFLPREQIEQATSASNSAMAADDEKLAAEAEAAARISSVLFVMVDVDSLQASIAVPTVVGTLEPVDPRLLRPTALDYARGVRDRIEQSQARIRFESEAEPAARGGADAARIRATTESPGGALQQTFWFCVRGRLLLSLVASHFEDAQAARIDQALAGFRFAP
jgi:hypothetical protein